MALTQEDISIIQRTWEIPRKTPTEAGVTILTKYFETFPDHLKKFEKFKNIPLEELKETDKFKKHAGKVIEVFDKSVTALSSDNSAAMIDELWNEVGNSHFRKKIPKSYFNDIKGVIFEVLGPLCNLNARDAEAWTKFFDIAYNITFRKMDELQQQ